MKKLNFSETLSKVYEVADIYGFDKENFSCKTNMFDDVVIKFDSPYEYDRQHIIETDKYTSVEIENMLSRIFN